MARLLPDYPYIKVEVIIDYGLTDIAAEGYDAGIRLGEQVAKDMIAVRIGPDMRMAVVGAPSYFARRNRPRTPKDLTDHDCINLRLPTYGGLYGWEFEKGGRELKVRVEGQFVFNNIALRLHAALAGFGLAYLPEDQGCRRISPMDGSSACSPTGARLSQAITSTTPAAAISRQLSPCWSMRCGTGTEPATRNAWASERTASTNGARSVSGHGSRKSISMSMMSSVGFEQSASMILGQYKLKAADS